MNPNRITLDLVVKAGDPDPEHPHGTFKAVLSTDRVDRDDEVIDPFAFSPLPASIPIHTDHRMDVDSVIGRATPFYDGDVLKARGYFGGDERSQTVRAKIADGLVTSMSVGAIRPERTVGTDGITHITKATLIESSVVTIPANTDALIAAKSLAADLEHALEDPAPEVRGEAAADPAPADVGTEPAEPAPVEPVAVSLEDRLGEALVAHGIDPVAAAEAAALVASDSATTTNVEAATSIDDESEPTATTDPDGTAGAPEAPAAPLAPILAETHTAADRARLRALRLS